MEEDEEEVECKVSTQFIRNVGDACGVGGMDERSASLVADDVSFRLRELVETAAHLAAQGRRTRLTVDDFARACRSHNVAPLYGYTSGLEAPSTAVKAGGRELWVAEEAEVDLGSLVASAAPKAPLDVSLKAHWLAVSGLQPLVPENPAAEADGRPANEDAAQEAERRDLRWRSAQQLVSVKTLARHSISLEQQVYIKEVAEACVGSDEPRRQEALKSLESDTGLQALLPRLVLFISEGIMMNIASHNLALLIYLMRMARALDANPAVNLEKSLHELVPCVLSCVISRNLCNRPSTDNHWALRDFAARLIATLAKGYDGGLSGLRGRTVEVLARSVDPGAPYPVLYGAANAIGEFGPQAVRTFLLPKIRSWLGRRLEETMTRNIKERPTAEPLLKLLVKVLVQSVVKGSDLRDQSDFAAEFGPYVGPLVFQASAGVLASSHAKGYPPPKRPRLVSSFDARHHSAHPPSPSNPTSADQY